MGVVRQEIVRFDFTCDRCERQFGESGSTVIGLPMVINTDIMTELAIQRSGAQVRWTGEDEVAVLCPPCRDLFTQWWLAADRRPVDQRGGG